MDWSPRGFDFFAARFGCLRAAGLGGDAIGLGACGDGGVGARGDGVFGFAFAFARGLGDGSFGFACGLGDGSFGFDAALGDGAFDGAFPRR